MGTYRTVIDGLFYVSFSMGQKTSRRILRSWQNFFVVMNHCRTGSDLRWPSFWIREGMELAHVIGSFGLFTLGKTAKRESG
jgi:hypothetical protein